MKGWQKLVLILFIIFTIPFGLLYGIKIWGEHKVNKYFSEEQKTEMESFKTKKISVKKYKPIMPKRADTIEDLTKSLSDEYEAIDGNNFFGKYQRNMSKDKKAKIEEEIFADIKKIEPLIEKFKALIDSPDYDLNFAYPKVDFSKLTGLPMPNYLFMQNSVKGLILQAKWFWTQDRYEEAFINAEYIIRASYTDHYSRLISSLIGIGFYSWGAETWHELAMKCRDLNLLKNTFNRQKELMRDTGFLLKDISPQITDFIGSLKVAERFGIKTDFENKTGNQINAEYYKAEAEFLEKIVLPNIHNRQIENDVKSRIESYRMFCAISGGEAIGLKPKLIKIIGPFIRDHFFAGSMPNLLEAYTRDDAALTKYNLMLVETAKKIYELENKKEMENLSELVPDYLSEIPKDLFSENGTSLIYDKRIFSIGPDKNDTEGLFIYDPTNGTISPGDIYFPE